MTNTHNLTSEDGFNADAIVEPIQTALEAAREEARTLSDDQLARALQCLHTHKDWQPDARLIRTVAIAAIEHIRADRMRHRLLTHYGTKDPTRFCQVDSWFNGDDITGCDGDGDGMTIGATCELMHGADVRVLIPDSIQREPAEFARLVRKVADWIEGPGNLESVRRMRADHEAPCPADFTNPDLPF
ncbi:hypothetical protein [Paracoccus aeridis]|uniref:hypothetical protein n=1 Tax=Paracoccus aeridis TaxID=1966466 RepID=UPI0010AA13F3|nr:hypothetical protein [Paracoccus aeridis]